MIADGFWIFDYERSRESHPVDVDDPLMPRNTLFRRETATELLSERSSNKATVLMVTIAAMAVTRRWKSVVVNMQPPGAGDRELGCVRGGPALLAFLFSLLPFPFFLTSVFFLACFLVLPSWQLFKNWRVPDDHSFLTKMNYLTKNMQNANSYFSTHAGTQKERVSEEGEIGVFLMTIHFWQRSII